MQPRPRQPRRNVRRRWVWVVGLLLLLGGALWFALRGGGWGGFASIANGGSAAAVALDPTDAKDAKVPDGPLTIYCGRPEPLMAPLFARFGAEAGGSYIVRDADSRGLEKELV